ncbi:MAG: YciI family protein [Bryobacteraceae bacterium]
MKFLMMMHMKAGTHNQGEGITTWPPEDIQAHIGFMISFNKQLKQNGELVSAEGLSWPDQAKIVRAGAGGVPVTDGVFPETKEFLIGYWVIDVASAERAYEIAAHVSAAPGRGGVPLNMPIEVRQVMAGPPEDFA